MILEKVLIVEDEPQAALFIYEIFKNEWAHIDHAGSVHEAVTVIEKTGNNYDFIFLDMNLPDMRGVATVKTILAATNSPIVVFTGDIDLAVELESNGSTLGIYGVVRKGSWAKHHVSSVIEKAILKWQMECVETTLRTLKEEKAEFRRKLLAHGH